MIRPLSFTSTQALRECVVQHPIFFEQVQYICIQGRAYEVQTSSKDVNALGEAELYVLWHKQNDLGDLQAGNSNEAALIKDILFNPPKPPPIVTLIAPTITNPTTPNEQRLNRLAGYTRPIDAYEIGSPFDCFLSPVATNIQVTQPGHIIPAHYYAPMNAYPNVKRGQSITTGITPRGDLPRTEAFWLLTQQQKTDTIVDLCRPLEGAAAAFTAPYYPSIPNQTVQYGCMLVRNIESDVGTTFFEVTNTITGRKSTVKLLNTLWDTEQLVAPAQLHEIAAIIAQNERPIILSENGHSKTGMAVIAAKMVELSARGWLFEGDNIHTLDQMIVSAREAIGPNVICTPEELQLLISLFDIAYRSRRQ